MARKFPPMTWVNVDAAGLGDLTFGSVPDSRMQTPIEAGLVDGDEPGYYLAQGGDFEEGVGLISNGGTKLIRRVTRSRKDGVLGTELIDVGSGADVRLMWDSNSAQQVWDNLGRMSKMLDVIYTTDQTFTVGGGNGKLHVFNKATAITVNLPPLADTLEDLYVVRNIGAGTLTIDPDGSEQIENALTLAVPQGYMAWITVNADKTGWRGVLLGTSSPTNYLIKAAQTLTPAEQSQVLVNLGLSGSRDKYKNRIVNPAMQASQQNGNTASGADAYFPADQWSVRRTTSAGVISSQRVQVNTPKGSADRLRVSVTTADTSLAAGEFLGIFQEIEASKMRDLLWGTASPVPATFTFGFKGPAGTYGVFFNASGGGGYLILPFTVTAPNANTDQYYTLAVPGPTIGTFPSGSAYYVRMGITLAAGTNFAMANTGAWGGLIGLSPGGYWPVGHASLSNGLGANTNVFELFDVQLHSDPSGTGIAPAWELPDEHANILECMRYWRQVRSYLRMNVTSGTGYLSKTDTVIPFRTGNPVLSGVNQAATSFPATVGTLTYAAAEGFIWENRTANATATGTFHSTITCDDR